MRKYILSFAALMLGLAASGQRLPIMQEALNNFRERFPLEKLYIHFDKRNYAAGETVWFKAYLFHMNRPSDVSNNLYIEILDPQGTVVGTGKYPVKSATVAGSISIPDSSVQGIYTVRAFTPAMLQPDADFVYKKNLFILRTDTTRRMIAARKPDNGTLYLRFFPEGGNIVGGIFSVIGFEATNEFGYPVDVEGQVVMDNEIQLASLKTYHDGIGQFRLKTQAGKKYVATICYKEQEYNFPLPAVLPAGMTITVNGDEKQKHFEVNRDIKQKIDLNTYRVIGQINNVVVYEKEFYFGSGYAVSGTIATDSFPSGILHISVLNDDYIPILERICFVNNHEYEAGGKLTMIETGTLPRTLNRVQITFPDTAQRSCSIAITDLATASRSNDPHIISSLLLTSDLRGTIHNPDFYFASKNDSVPRALDNLMLTHGWTRFNWNKIMHNEYTPAPRKDEYLVSLSGKVLTPRKEAVSRGKLNVFIAAEDSSLYSYQVPVSDSGTFFIDSLLLAGKSRIYYSYLDPRNKTKPVSVVINQNKDSLLTISGESETLGFAEDEMIEAVATAKFPKAVPLDKGYDKAVELENVTVTTRTKRPIDALNEKYSTGIFRTGSRYMIDNINDPGTKYMTGGGGGRVISFIMNRLPNITFDGEGFVNRKYFSAMYTTTVYWKVGVFIDEVPVRASDLDQMRLEQIALVKFFDAGFPGVGSDFGGGAIAIYTKKNETPQFSKPSASFFLYNGYSVEKEFFSPDYSQANTQTKRDNRTTLYWNPSIITGSQEDCIDVKFYNNDFSKAFKIVLEGIDAKGRLIYLDKTVGN